MVEGDFKRHLHRSSYFLDEDAFFFGSLSDHAQPVSPYGRIDRLYRLARRYGLLADYTALIRRHLSGQPADNISESAIDALSSEFSRILSPRLAANEQDCAPKAVETGSPDQSSNRSRAAEIQSIQLRASELGIKVFLDFFSRSQFGTSDLSQLSSEQLNDLSSHLDRYADYASKDN